MVHRSFSPGLARPGTALDSVAACLLAALAAACLGPDPAKSPPPLSGMEEPLPLLEEPRDEAERAALPTGGFTGLYVKDARASLDDMLGEPEGVLVERIVENSPAAVAGLADGDLLFEAERVPADAGGASGGEGAVALHWPSDWRALELASRAGDTLRARYDRAGVEGEARIAVIERVAPAARRNVERVREERRVGVVLRSATEVEARAAGLAPGAGAVVVGLSQDSPWRRAGVRYEDLIVTVDGRAVGHPLVVVDAIRLAGDRDHLELGLVRGGAPATLQAPVSRRAQELKKVRVVPLYSFTRERDSSESSFLFGLVRWRRTPAAWDLRLLWLISFGGGDADRLVEVAH